MEGTKGQSLNRKSATHHSPSSIRRRSAAAKSCDRLNPAFFAYASARHSSFGSTVISLGTALAPGAFLGRLRLAAFHRTCCSGVSGRGLAGETLLVHNYLWRMRMPDKVRVSTSVPVSRSALYVQMSINSGDEVVGEAVPECRVEIIEAQLALT